MRNAIRLIIALYVCFIFFSCDHQEEVKTEIIIPEEFQEIFDKGVRFDAASTSDTGSSAPEQTPSESLTQSQTIQFTATDKWTTIITETESAAWITVSPESGDAGDATITITVDPNTSQEPRSVVITIQCGDRTIDITVIQDGIPETPLRYLTFISEGSSTIALKSLGLDIDVKDPILYYSRDTKNWNLWDYSELTFTKESPVYIYGDNNAGFNYFPGSGYPYYYSYFVQDGDQFEITGDICSLLDGYERIDEAPSPGCFFGLFYGCRGLKKANGLVLSCMSQYCYAYMFSGIGLTSPPQLPAKELAPYCYQYMFLSCTDLASAPQLPATKLAVGCYCYMFGHCTSLTSAPELSATALADWCCQCMFKDCTGLISAPELSATALADGCYQRMFEGCSSLLAAPALPANKLANGCYFGMFSGCTSLSYSPLLPASKLEPNCYCDMFKGCTDLKNVKCLAIEAYNGNNTYDWVLGVGERGVFLRGPNSYMWPVGDSGIPEGWVVKYYLGCHDLQSLDDPLLCDCFGGGFDLILPEGTPWTIIGGDGGVVVQPESSNGETSIATLVIEENDGDEDREFVLHYTIGEGDAATMGDIRIIQTSLSLTIGDYKYKIKKMLDGRWWMVENLHYVPEGVTIGDGQCGIWYPCSDTALEFDTSEEGIISKGLLYSDEFAFNCHITSTTAKRLEGAQGICPSGWHIPTLSEFMALVGKSTNSNLEVNTEAPYYDPACGHGSLSILDEAGFNTTMAGYVQGKGKGFEANGDIRGYLASMGYIVNNYIFCSTVYFSSMWYALVFNRAANTADVGMMSNSTSSRPFAGSVRCIKDE
ncbi:MAG: hypothetical protein IJR25_00935 [Bacteroidales bacterium]|nr:hypothetical protein [Bacteroidales bacterium]